ncbi:MAG: TIGR01777 family protein [Candidatus Eisenbacteria bacterium]|nr:TIGR01777 family protein [Candidatus Eisenbacteria bacterium]
MKILITGATGFVGSSLRRALAGEGHSIVVLTRSREPSEGSATWDPRAGKIDRDRLEGLDAVVHLAGESIGAGRWTRERKDRILRSRVDGTRLLASSLVKLERRPRILISASAVGYYGDRGEVVLDEESGPGDGFLADVCRSWEAAAEPASREGIDVVALRIGMVLGAEGGVLARLRPIFRVGMGAVQGSGRQYVSWITLDDLVGIVRHFLSRAGVPAPGESRAGRVVAVNAVAPNPVTNRQFTKALAQALGRPAILVAPGWALRLAMGEMAGPLLLASARAVPRRALESGYEFRHPELAGALRAISGRMRDS